MDFGLIWKATLERILVQSLSFERIVANAVAGVVIAVIAVLFLKYHEKKDKDYIVLNKRQTTLFILLMMMAVVFISPLPIRGKGDVIETVSVFVTILVLGITSYMDKQTGTFVNGYMVIGLFVNAVLCVAGLCFKGRFPNKTLILVFFCCVVVNIFFGIISYTSADAGLINMALCSFALIDFGNVLFAFVLCEVVASVLHLLKAIPKVKRKLENHEKLRFPFAPSIFAGVVITLFYIG